MCEQRERVSLETILKKLAVPGSETRAEAAASRPAPFSKPAPVETKPPAPRPASSPASSAKETFLNDPAIKAALKDFDARIVDR
jgi:hypothetical protein